MLDLGFLPDVEKLLAQTPAGRQTMLFSATMPGPVVVAGAPLHDAADAHPRGRPGRHRRDGQGDQAGRVPRARDGQGRDGRPDPAGPRPRPRRSSSPGPSAPPPRSPTSSTERGFAVGAVHGDLGQGAREQALRAFRNGKVDVLVATDVAARGIDVDDVTHVINYQCPEDEKTYLHRIGRTGRAGDTGIAVTFVDWDDMPRWQLINKALDLGIPEPQETYSTSAAPLRRPGHPRGHQGRPAARRSAPGPAWTPRTSRTSARPAAPSGTPAAAGAPGRARASGTPTARADPLAAAGAAGTARRRPRRTAPRARAHPRTATRRLGAPVAAGAPGAVWPSRQLPPPWPRRTPPATASRPTVSDPAGDAQGHRSDAEGSDGTAPDVVAAVAVAAAAGAPRVPRPPRRPIEHLIRGPDRRLWEKSDRSGRLSCGAALPSVAHVSAACAARSCLGADRNAE